MFLGCPFRIPMIVPVDLHLGFLTKLLRSLPRGSVYSYRILWPQSAFYMGALGPEYRIYGYLDPLGLKITNHQPYSSQHAVHCNSSCEALGRQEGQHTPDHHHAVRASPKKYKCYEPHIPIMAIVSYTPTLFPNFVAIFIHPCRLSLHFCT